MTLDGGKEYGWTSTALSLSQGALLFDNDGIQRLRRALEDSFAVRYLLEQGGVNAFAATATGVLPMLQQHGRTMVDGARIVFDLRSPEHWQIASQLHPQLPSLTLDPDVELCTPERLLQVSSEHGFRLVELEPYGGLWDNALLLGQLDHPLKWRRLLSWLERDEMLFGLLFTIEQEVFARLGSSMTGRYLVALEKSANTEDNEQWLEKLAHRQEQLADVESWLQCSPEEISRLVEPLTRSLRCQHILFILDEVLAKVRSDIELQRWLPSAVGAQLERWRQAQFLDAQALDIARYWAQGEHLRERQGVDIVCGLEYQLVAALLRDHFKIHNGDTR